MKKIEKLRNGDRSALKKVRFFWKIAVDEKIKSWYCNCW